jgi:hypothetical protein
LLKRKAEIEACFKDLPFFIGAIIMFYLIKSLQISRYEFTVHNTGSEGYITPGVDNVSLFGRYKMGAVTYEESLLQ